MSVQRYRQTSLVPELVPDRLEGRIPGSVQTGSNADLVATVAPLYLTGSVCDLTYGVGGWWRRFRPDPFVGHDLDPQKGDGVDFTALPEDDETYDATTFDPPYIAPGGLETSTAPEFRARFGLLQRTRDELWSMIGDGLAEASRVTKRRGYVLVKCMDATFSEELELGHVRVVELGRELGLRTHDLIVHHTGSGPGGHNIATVKRARRHHSYLVVFRVM